MLFGIAILIFIVVAFVALLIVFLRNTDFSTIESDVKRAGRRGEQFATQIIKETLNEKEVLLTNLKLAFDGKETELDNVIINNRGIFIVEVKNYGGELVGDADDYEWIQSKITDAGHFYQKSVKNPIKQVKRQIYILAEYLKQYGIDVWVEGYVFFVNMNSPVENKIVLKTQKDINEVIHFRRNNKIKNDDKNRIVNLLSGR
jgi:hypothetical protein